MGIRVLDPTYEEGVEASTSTARLTSIEGRTIGLLDNRKYNVHELLNHMESLFITQHGVKRIIRLQKPDASRPAPPEVVEEIKQCDALISAVGD